MRAVAALCLEQQELATLLANPNPCRSEEELSRLRAVKDRVDGTLQVLEHMTALVQHVCVAIGAFRSGMLDEGIDLVNAHLFRETVASRPCERSA